MYNQELGEAGVVDWGQGKKIGAGMWAHTVLLCDLADRANLSTRTSRALKNPQNARC
jgi:hypothetical protein